MHIGPKAHRLFGKEVVAEMFARNEWANGQALEQTTVNITLDGNGAIGKEPIEPLAPGFR